MAALITFGILIVVFGIAWMIDYYIETKDKRKKKYKWHGFNSQKLYDINGVLIGKVYYDIDRWKLMIWDNDQVYHPRGVTTWDIFKELDTYNPRYGLGTVLLCRFAKRKMAKKYLETYVDKLVM
jgi:hypothetical protein